MDISATTAPRSDQQNFDDYQAGPRTVTITEVKAGTAEQPVEIHLAEFPGRPYKPSKSMRRVLVAAWGPEASTYVGRRMKLVGDPSVKFGGIALGGIKIAALSDIDQRLSISLTVSKGKRAPHTVDPLPAAPVLTEEDVQLAALRNAWATADAERRKVIEAEVAELSGTKEAPKEAAQPETPADPALLDDPTADPDWKGDEE